MFVSFANAGSLNEAVIQVGPNKGKRLKDVVESYVVPGREGKDAIHIPGRAIQDAFDFYDCNHTVTREYQVAVREKSDLYPDAERFSRSIRTQKSPAIANDRYMVIFDLNQHSSTPRLHIIDLQTGEIESTEAAHAKKTDCPGERSGYACQFAKNDDASNETPLGFFETGDLYTGVRTNKQKVPMVELKGLESKSGKFAGNFDPSSAVIHPAEYVRNGRAGRSTGCPALNVDVMNKWKGKIKDGALFYFYHSSLDTMERTPKMYGAIGPGCKVAPSGSVQQPAKTSPSRAVQ